MRQPSAERGPVVLLEAIGGLLRRMLPLSAPGRLLQVPLTVSDLAGVPGGHRSGSSAAVPSRGALAGLVETCTDLLEGAQG